MLNSIILLGGLVSAFGLGAISPNQEKQDNVQFRLENHKSVQYDDEQYKITLSADEVDNFQFQNLYNYVYDNQGDVEFLFVDESFSFYEYLVAYDCIVYQSLGEEQFVFYGNVEDFNEYGDTDYTLSYSFFCGFEGQPPYSTTLTIICDENNYVDVKQAIELDIQANQPNNDYSSILGDIVSLLVGGITSFAGGLGAGVSAFVGDIFINNGSLSVFGYMVVIFAGIALAIGLSRWVMNFLTSLGRKK